MRLSKNLQETAHSLKRTLLCLKTLALSSNQYIAKVGSFAFAWFFIFGVKVTHAFVGATVLGWLGGGLKSALTWLAYLMLASWVVGMLLWFSGSIFDLVLDTTILKFASLLGSVGTKGSLMQAIYTIWTASRDIANILIIGIFVYIAINKILGTSKDFKKMVVSLLSVAVLINFSFFFAQTAVDISNWSAVQVYNAISPEAAAADVADKTVRLSETIIHNMGGVEAGIDALRQAGSFFSVKGLWQGALDFIPYMLVTTVLTLITAILFFRMAFILIGRWLILVILMSTSSLAFAAMLIPKLQPYWKNWYEGLIYNAIVAPLLLLLLWAVTLLMQGVAVAFPSNWGNTTPSLAKIAEGQASGGSFILALIGFIITIGLLWAAIRIATMLSNKASESAGGLGKGVSNLLGRVEGAGYGGLSSGIGWAGRNSYGAGFTSMGKYFDKKAENTSSARMGQLYSGLGNTFKKQGDRGLDPRSAKFVQDFGKSAGASMGKANTEGFQKYADRREKEQKDLAKKQQANLETAREGEAEIVNALTDKKKATEEREKQFISDLEKNTAERKDLQDALKDEDASLNTAKIDNDKKNGEFAEVRVKREEAQKEFAAATGANSELEGTMGEQESKIEKIKNAITERKALLEKGNPGLNTNKIQSQLSTLQEAEKAGMAHLKTLTKLDKYEKDFERLGEEVEESKELLKGRRESVREAKEAIEKNISTLESEYKELREMEKENSNEDIALGAQISQYAKSWDSAVSKLNIMKEFPPLSSAQAQKLHELQTLTDTRHLDESEKVALGKLLKQKNDNTREHDKLIGSLRKTAAIRNKDKEDYDSFKKYSKWQEEKETVTTGTVQQKGLDKNTQKAASSEAAGVAGGNK